jgi:hypothetical protein
VPRTPVKAPPKAKAKSTAYATKPKAPKVTATRVKSVSPKHYDEGEPADLGFNKDGTPRKRNGQKRGTGKAERPPVPKQPPRATKVPAKRTDLVKKLLLDEKSKVKAITRYTPAFCDLVRRFGRMGKGLTNNDLAELFEVNEKTIREWMHKYPDFMCAVIESRDFSDARVERCLFERATGYSCREDKVFFHARTGKVVTVTTDKHYPPDTGAAFIWLKNRQPDRWKDRVEYVPPGGGRRIVVVDEDGSVVQELEE